MTNTLKTQRLEIRPYQETDLQAFAELLANKEIQNTFMIPSYDTPEAYELLAKRLLAYSYSEAHFERGIYRENRLIGFVNDVQKTEDTIELGYVIHPLFQGQGYATEMLRAVICELFSMGFRKITAGAFADNLASIRVMQKCGMSKTDIQESVSYRGELRPCVYYEMLREEPPARRFRKRRTKA